MGRYSISDFGGTRMMTSRSSRSAQPPARILIVAWNICGTGSAGKESFFAAIVKRTSAPGTTPLKVLVPASIVGGLIIGGGGGRSKPSGLTLLMKSAVVLPVGTISPAVPCPTPAVDATTSKLE